MWVKIDDGMAHHPKLVAAGPQAFALDVAGICYSSRFDTDGFVADGALAAVLPGLSQPKRHARQLVQIGRWERDDISGGYRIHDYEEYQFSSERRAERDRERSEKAVLANHQRWHVGRDIVSPDCPLCVPDASQAHPNGDSSGSPNGFPGDPPTRPDLDLDLQGIANEPESVSNVPPDDAATRPEISHLNPRQKQAVEALEHRGKTLAGALEMVEKIGADAVLTKLSEAS